MRDFRFVTVLPNLAAIFIAVAPSQITERASSMFDLKDPTIRDRIAMLRIGARMVEDHPLTGVGPNMIQRRYAEYRESDQSPINPHLHNVPIQIAAERGLPALGVWLWFIVVADSRSDAPPQAGRRSVLCLPLRLPPRSGCWPRDCSNTISAIPNS